MDILIPARAKNPQEVWDVFRTLRNESVFFYDRWMPEPLRVSQTPQFAGNADGEILRKKAIYLIDELISDQSAKTRQKSRKRQKNAQRRSNAQKLHYISRHTYNPRSG